VQRRDCAESASSLSNRTPVAIAADEWEASAGTLIGSRAAPARVGGCRKKPFKKTRSTLAEVHVSAAMHDALATDRLLATDEMAVLGTHPYRRSSGLARGFPDSVPGRRRPPLRHENPCARIDAGEAWCVSARATAWRGDLWDR
jgi:hypothetical protein